MQTKTKLELLRAMQQRRKATQAGFTLVEVLVVAGILAILFASLVPNLLAARGRAQASAYVSEAVGIARACQAVVASGTGLDTFISPADGASITCDGTNTSTSGPIVSKTWSRVLIADDNITCPNPAQSDILGAGQLQLSILPADNSITCTVI